MDEEHTFAKYVKSNFQFLNTVIIKNLKLQNFRNFEKKRFDFIAGTNIIVGRNTTGKTNTLEAVYLLSTGKSFRANLEAEIIKDGEDLARIAGEVEVSGEKADLEVVMVGESEESRGGKKMSINGVFKRVFTYAGLFKTVMFGPWDLSLVTESPSIRRRFLDAVLSQVDREYRRSLLSYEKGVRQRNRVLERIREGVATRSQLLYWDHLIIREGNYITSIREKFVDFVNSTPSRGESFSLEYERSTISPARLEQYKAEEVMAATTLVGPHRDDITFKISKSQFPGPKNLSSYGSRGEQRMAVLWVKLAELEFIERETGERPVLLLDDIFSELDPDHHEIVMETVSKQQTILTTAEPREAIKEAYVINL